MFDSSSSYLDSYCIDDSLIACEICYEPFHHTNRPPKLLPCGHNFCETCLFSICCHQEYYLLDSIKCPTCRRTFATDTARQAPTNYDLCKVLENCQKRKEQNVTVIQVKDEPIVPRGSNISEKCKELAKRTDESKHLRCADCQKKISQKSLFRVSRYCVDCTSTSRMTIVCLECCVNLHNGHVLFSEDQLHHNQLKVLAELRAIRSRVVDSSEGFDRRSEEIRESGRDVCVQLTSEKHNLLTYTLASIDDVIRRIEMSPIMFPPVLRAIRDEQLQNFSRLRQLNTVLEKSQVNRRKPSGSAIPSTSSESALNRSLSIRQSRVSHRGDDTLWHDAIRTLCRQRATHPMCLQLQFHHSTINAKDTVEERQRKIMSCAHAATCMIDVDAQPMLAVFADVLLNSFYQLDRLSKSRFGDVGVRRVYKRSEVWKQVQISYTELLGLAAKNLPAFHPERVDILDDLAYLCHLFADVCDQATVTICIIEASRARAADSSSLTELEQRRAEERLASIDEHLCECRRQQKLLNLRKTTKTKRTHGFKRLFGSCFMPQSAKIVDDSI